MCTEWLSSEGFSGAIWKVLSSSHDLSLCSFHCLLTAQTEGAGGRGPTDSFGQAYLIWFGGLLGAVGEIRAGDFGSVVSPTSVPLFSWHSLCTSFIRCEEVNSPYCHSFAAFKEVLVNI